MRIRRLSLVVLLLLVPTTAHAHDHFADAYAAVWPAMLHSTKNTNEL